jgi:chromosome segregation ATPase
VTVSDLTTEILIQIRDGVHELREHAAETNARLDRTRTELVARIDQTNLRLDRTRTELIAKIEQTNAKIDGTNTRLGRLEDGVSTLIGQVTILADRDRGLGDTVADLQRRVEALEASSHG